MSTWLALALPALPLQLAERALEPALARTLALAVVEGPTQRARIACCNATARAAGIHPGMSLAAAQALAHDLVAPERDSAREHAALQALCCWAYQFSSRIVPFAAGADGGLLIETGASERLFGGAERLRRRITAQLQALGYRAASASAATPAAARVLALARARAMAAPAAAPDPATSGPGAPGLATPGPATPGPAAPGLATPSLATPDPVAPDALRPALSGLALQLLGWEDTVLQTLATLGVETIGAVLALPRASFARRFGAQRLTDLDRLLGVLADPQPVFCPPERFRVRVDLPADLCETAQLQTPLRHLLVLLEGFLRGQGTGATALMLRAHHGRQRERVLAPTAVPLALTLPERAAPALLRLYGERLARVRLPDAACALELELERTAPLVPRSASLLPPAPGADAQDFDALQLAQTLHARLGTEGVFRLQALEDHRPEYAYRLLPLTAEPAPGPAGACLPLQRPLFILTAPRPLPTDAANGTLPHYAGPLALLCGPERIEAGWWDLGPARHGAVHRDYFVARNDRGQTLWIYQELAPPRQWFLHGFFS